jgi:hypothetical protein
VGHNGTLERHRGPTHLETIPCLFTGREPLDLQSRHFPGGPYTVSGHMIVQSFANFEIPSTCPQRLVSNFGRQLTHSRHRALNFGGEASF